MAYTVEQLENYGRDVQNRIADTMSDLLTGVKGLDVGQQSTYLTELSQTADIVTKKLPQNSFMKPVFGVKRWLAKFESVENSLTRIEDTIQEDIDKRNRILNGLIAQKDALKGNIESLTQVETELKGIISEIQSGDNDELLLYAATHRLKIVTVTREVSTQELAKTLIQLRESKEVTYQLEEAVTNLIPIFKTMMMNCVAAKANQDSIKLRKALEKTANKLVIESAKQMEKTAADLVEGRNSELIAPATLKEANQILQRTVKTLVDGSRAETASSMELITSLQSTSESLKSLEVSI